VGLPLPPIEGSLREQSPHIQLHHGFAGFVLKKHIGGLKEEGVFKLS